MSSIDALSVSTVCETVDGLGGTTANSTSGLIFFFLPSHDIPLLVCCFLFPIFDVHEARNAHVEGTNPLL